MGREYEKAVDYVRRMISSGSLNVGDRLPTERELSLELDISRNSTREAMRMLENMGIIVSRHGSGNYISGNMERTISDMINMMLALKQVSRHDICDFRRSMEKTVCHAVIDRLEAGSDKPDELDMAAELAYSMDCSDSETDRRFHYLLVKASGNAFIDILMSALIDVYREWIDEALEAINGDDKLHLKKAHEDIINALHSRDKSACDRAIDMHYNINEQSLTGQLLSFK